MHVLNLSVPPAALPPSLQIGRFVLQTDQRRLLLDGAPVPLGGRALDVLIVLVRSAGSLLGRQHLLDAVWPGLVVEDGNLSVQINALRKVLGNDSITTVPGHGYRFQVPTGLLPGGPPAPHTPTALPLDGAVVQADKPPSPPTPQTLHTPPTHLPAALSTLLGRDADLHALAALVDGNTLVTVLGPTGVGKTRLVQALLQDGRAHYTHGVCFVELGAVAAQHDVAQTIAAAVGVRLAGVADPASALVQALAPLCMLLSLDNAEHLIDGVAAVASALVAGAPGVKLLVTSQAPLRVAEETLYRLQPLTLPPSGTAASAALGYGAVALLAQRVQAVDRGFVVDANNVAQVIELCTRLDGTPLAIELAAARMPLLGLPALLASLDERLRVLTQGRRDAPPRHRALRAALTWSHDLLSPVERTVFRRLAVFAGSVSITLARAVVADAEPGDSQVAAQIEPPIDAWQALDALGTLVDRSLLVVLGQDPAQRLRLLDSPHALAREKLLASGDLAPLQRRHAAAVLALLEQACADLLAGRQGLNAVIDTLAPDIANAQAALTWATSHAPAQALAIAPLLSQVLGRHRYAEATALWQQVEPLLDQAAPVATTSSSASSSGSSTPVTTTPATTPSTTAALAPLPLARALLHCAEHWQSTRTQHACARAQQARTLALAAGDARTAYQALWVIAFAAYRSGDHASLRTAALAARAAENPAWPAQVLLVRASIEALLCVVDQDHDGAINWRLQQAALLRAAGASDAIARINIASAQLVAGRCEEAISTARALVDGLSGARDQRHRCFALSNLSGALLTLGRAAEARQVLQDAWPLAGQFDLLPQWADDAALIAALEQRPCSALRLVGYADAAFAALGQPREAIDQARIDQANTLAQAALLQQTAKRLPAHLKAEGALLRDTDLPTLAFATADPD